MIRSPKSSMFRGIRFLVLAGVAFAWGATASAQSLERELGTIIVDHPQIQG
mgnify:FL=1